MDNLEQLEYKLQLLCIYKEKFYTKNLMYRVMAKISRTMSKILDKKAITWAEAMFLKEIEKNGHPDSNPFLDNRMQAFTLFYTPGLGLSEIPKTEKAIRADDANESYKAVKERDDSPWYCDIIDEEMFDLLNEKYEIDRTGGFLDQLRVHVEKAKCN